MLYDPKQNPVVKVLYDAADLIDQRGLAKGIRRDSEGRLCLHGAIEFAMTGTAWSSGEKHKEVSRHVRKYLEHNLGFVGLTDYGCAEWNNAPERTKQEVVDALRGAAEMLIVTGG
jgi:hypothetical protein